MDNRKEKQSTASLEYFRETLRSNRYPHPDDMLAVIDELEASWAAHLQDLEDIDKVLTRNFRGTDFVNDAMAARGWSVARFVRARLNRRREVENSDVIGILKAIDKKLSHLTSPTTLSQFTWGVEEARRVIRDEIRKLEATSDE